MTEKQSLDNTDPPMSDADIGEKQEKINDDDILNFEDDISSVLAESVAQKVNKIEKTETKKKRAPLKSDICDDIIKLNNELGRTPVEKKTLMRMKLQQLEKKLAGLITIGVDAVQKEELGVNGAPAIDGDVEYATNALYTLNLTACYFAEKLSVSYRDELGGDLDGWSDNIKRDKKALKEILKEIYKENKEIVDEYVSPACTWFLFMITTATVTYSDNLKKKPKTSQSARVEPVELSVTL